MFLIEKITKKKLATKTIKINSKFTLTISKIINGINFWTVLIIIIGNKGLKFTTLKSQLWKGATPIFSKMGRTRIDWDKKEIGKHISNLKKNKNKIDATLWTIKYLKITSLCELPSSDIKMGRTANILISNDTHRKKRLLLADANVSEVSKRTKNQVLDKENIKRIRQ